VANDLPGSTPAGTAPGTSTATSAGARDERLADPALAPAIAAARAAVHAFLEAFNRTDVPAMTAAMNFPHVRLAGGTFTTSNDPAHFLEQRRMLKAVLAGEGWDHTVLESIEVVHAGRQKVHMSLLFTRRRADGTVYNRFHTLWIATELDGHWGVQFRSSYLE
jgi:hypothetical protein